MIEEILCVDCQRVFYDWWDAENHVCAIPTVSAEAEEDLHTASEPS